MTDDELINRMREAYQEAAPVFGGEKPTRKAMAAALAAVRGEIRREAFEALGFGEPFPITDVLTRLADATEHLLGEHNCDCHGHEGRRYTEQAARAIAARIRALAASPPPVPADEDADRRVRALVNERTAHRSTRPVATPAGPTCPHCAKGLPAVPTLWREMHFCNRACVGAYATARGLGGYQRPGEAPAGPTVARDPFIAGILDEVRGVAEELGLSPPPSEAPACDGTGWVYPDDACGYECPGCPACARGAR